MREALAICSPPNRPLKSTTPPHPKEPFTPPKESKIPVQKINAQKTVPSAVFLNDQTMKPHLK